MISVLVILFLTVHSQGVHYDLTIIPDFDTLRFTSQVTINVKILEPVQNITLKTKIEDFQLTNAKHDNNIIVTYFEEDEDLVLHSLSEFRPGEHRVLLTYNGKMNEKQEGLYVARYMKQDGENQTQRIIALTNFHYNKASQVFPCYDEPIYPSTFNLSLVRPKDYVAVANTVKISEQEYDENRIIDTFAKTELIPTYMLSFAIIDFPETNYENVTVYSLSNETRFLEEWSAQVAKKFQEIETFGLTTTQQIVVPDNALPVNVLENVGLIMYRESAVVYNPERETVKDMQGISKLVTHAIVKQWYKNRDTFKWWPNYWVIEGLTAFYEYEVLDSLQPAWRNEEQFLIEELDDALEYDVGDNEFSLILTEDETPDSFSKFHQIKAFDFVRMFLHFPQSESILEEGNIVALSWSGNKGYPVLNVTRDYANNVLTFSQSTSNIHTIPINIFSEDQATDLDFDLIMEKDTEISNFSISGSWYIVNANRLGYFRSKYDTRNWESITTFLTDSQKDIGQISPINRAILVNDAFYLAELGYLPYSIYLDMVHYLRRENDYIPIIAFIRTANRLKGLLAKSNVEELFASFAKNLVQHFYDKVGTVVDVSESHLDSLSRAKILTWLCNFGHQRCQEEMFYILSKNPENVHPDLQEPVFCGGMRLGTLEHFTLLKEIFNATKKVRILKSMACTSDTQLLMNYTLALVDKSTIIKLEAGQKIDAFFAIIEGNSIAVDVVLDFLREYSMQLSWSFTDDEISNMLIALSKKLVTGEDAEKIVEIILSLGEAQETFQVVKNIIEANLKWRSSQLAELEEWLISNVIPETTEPGTTIVSSTTENSDSTGSATVLEVCHSSVFVYLILALIKEAVLHYY